ncbi:hypothetical protein H6F89_03565, partial [Cyanobacteria bacterium FACHB-63]|nr:hypothetical protein [Cyanobacteria bacterium FACHB-63]
MNGQSHEKITTEDLKAITQAPTVEEPLVHKGEFPVELARSSRPVWTKPVPKLALIGLLLIPVFGFAALFLAGGGRFKQAQKSSPQPTTETASQPETPSDELSRLREENGKLKANAAIGDQTNLQNRLAKNGKPEKLPRIPVKPSANATDSPKPVTIASAPPRIVSQASPPRLVSAPVSLPTSNYPSVARSRAAKEPTIQAKADIQPEEPMQQWQQLAQLGSYGSSHSDSSDSRWSNASSSHSNLSEDRTRVAQENSEDSLQSIPTARIAPTSAVQANAEMAIDTDQIAGTSDQLNTEQTDQPVKEQTAPRRTIIETQPESQVAAQYPISEHPILEDAEAAILQEQVRQHSLIAGESTPGILATPVTLSSSRSTEATRKTNPDRFTIVLSQPLKDSTGQVAIPSGAHLLAQVDQFSQTGQVQLSATTAVWDENGLQKELTLPSGVIQIRGENGKPLIAKQLEDRGKEIAAMDAGQFLLGAVRRSAQLFTRSNSQIQTGNGTTVIT